MNKNDKPVQGGMCRIGTSGLALPGPKNTFPAAYQASSRLHYYGSIFNTIEINSSFYKVPNASTLQKWAEEVPDHFEFTLKLWREITHVKQLMFTPENLDLFYKTINCLGNKSGCLLLQFPGKISLDDYVQLEKILEQVHQLNEGNKWRIAVECRNASWYVRETIDLLDEYDASLVVHDMPKCKNETPNGAAPFVYCRFHGTAGNYRGSYTPSFLQEKAKQIKHWMDEGKDVYVYFNNTMGSAFENARDLFYLVNHL